MSAPGPHLVWAKLWPPTPRAGLIPRASLQALLQTGLERKLCLVDAPVGFGKTTLLAQWRVAAGGGRVAWVSLDDGDNDPTRFWIYVTEALRTVEPSVGASALEALQRAGADLYRVVLPRLLNDLDGIGSPLVLVLDDYYLITEAACHQTLEFFLDYLPANVHLVLATRADPPLPLAGMRVRGELVEIRATELRFTEQEALALLNGSMGLQLTPEDVRRLVARTEGWAAGLYLAGLSLRSRPDPGAFIASFQGSHRHVADYLGTEVLSRQPEPVRTFLLRTSVLERLSGPLCDAVLETEGSAKLLQELERSNLFLVPLDDRRQWYRYHHLFTDVLRHKLATSEPELIPVLHRRASAWYRQADFPDQAIHHATAAGDLGEAGELIARHWITHVDRWLIATVRRWLRALPPAAVRSDPTLALVSAWIALSSYEPAELDRWLAIAEQLPSEGPLADGTPSLEVGIASLRAISGFEGIASKLAAARRVLELQPDPASPWRSGACWALGYSLYLSGRTAEARAPAEEAVRLSKDLPVITTRIRSLALLGFIEADQGHSDAAETHERTTSELVVRNGLAESPTIACAYILQGRIRWRRGDLDGALAAHEQAFALQRYPIERFHALVELVPVRLARGDHAGAEALMTEARRLQATGIDFGVLPQRLRAAMQRMDVTEHHLEQTSETRSARQVDLLGARSGAPGRRVEVSEPLTERELAVLRLLPARLSNREIGRELYVSINTVKTHLQAVYRKLGVTTRAEAVIQARKLGLIPKA
jgi:LuxR family maltose regulon positive regulatory protein